MQKSLLDYMIGILASLTVPVCSSFAQDKNVQPVHLFSNAMAVLATRDREWIFF